MQAKEKQRLTKEQTKIETQISSLEKKLANPSFTEKAPQTLVEQTRTLLTEAQSTYAKNEKLLESLNK